MAEHDENSRDAPDESGDVPTARDRGAVPMHGWPSPHPALVPFDPGTFGGSCCDDPLPHQHDDRDDGSARASDGRREQRDLDGQVTDVDDLLAALERLDGDATPDGDVGARVALARALTHILEHHPEAWGMGDEDAARRLAGSDPATPGIDDAGDRAGPDTASADVAERASYQPLYRRPVEQRSLFPELDGRDEPADPGAADRPSATPAEPVDLVAAAAAIPRFVPDDDRPLVRPDLSAERLDQALTSIFAGLAARADPSDALVGPGLSEPPVTAIPSRHADSGATVPSGRGFPPPGPDEVPRVHLTDTGLPRRATVPAIDVAPQSADPRSIEAARQFRVAMARHQPDPTAGRAASIAAAAVAPVGPIDDGPARLDHAPVDRLETARPVDDDGPARLDHAAIDRLETALGPMIADAAEARADHDAAPPGAVADAMALERRGGAAATPVASPAVASVFEIGADGAAGGATDTPTPILPGHPTRAPGDDGMGDLVAFPSETRADRRPRRGRQTTTGHPVGVGQRRTRRGLVAAAVALVVGGAGVTYLATRDGGGSLDSDASAGAPASTVAQLPPGQATAPDGGAAATTGVDDAAGTTVVPSTAPAAAGDAAAPAPSAPAVTAAAAPPEVGLESQFAGAGNDEWIRVVNQGTTAVNLAGWSLRDDGFAHLFQFGDRVLEPGTAVTLYSGCGVNNITELYWCTTTDDIWDDAGDVATLFDGDQFVVAVTRG